jgi:O-methyltransferase
VWPELRPVGQWKASPTARINEKRRMRQIIKSIAAKVPSGFYDRCRAWSVLEQNFRQSLSGAKELDSRESLWGHLFSRIGADQRILLLEFGVFNGYSIHQFAALNQHSASKFIGFDSFDGLPEDWARDCPKGTFSQGGQVPPVRDSRITLVKGWFSDTLIAQLQGIKSQDWITVCHFDADLYSSTLFCLTTVLQRFRRFYFVFDEFSGHEARALCDVMQAYPIDISFLGHTKEKFPHQVSGEVTNRTRI